MEFNKDGWQGPTIYTGNSVNTALTNLTKEKCEHFEKVHVSFNVTGRTRHALLAKELAYKLGDGYEVNIDCAMYKCEVRRHR